MAVAFRGDGRYIVFIMTLKLERPMVFFDIESTGLNRKTDRIVELAMIKIHPDGSRISVVFRVNPEMPISAEATRVHGITDEDVKDCKTFRQVAGDVAAFLEGCDLAGYNLIQFDVPMLEEEFKRADIGLSLKSCFVVDAQRIFYRMEPRDLTAALAFYCGEEHTGAHGALADVEATIKVLEGQIAKYTEVPEAVGPLADFCSPREAGTLDREGKLRWGPDGDVQINFGQNKGKSLRFLAENDKSYLNWILNKDFPDDVKAVVRQALDGVFPKKEG
ncbi:MAG: 3'-5' exonuclease [Kiritimatiellae bacterium]|nr:3'-5' exonuclease [Kiritimatiellia bacterium]